MQLADRLGVSQKVVTYWERESVGLKADQLIAVADALAISVDELLGRGSSSKQRGGPVGRARRVFDEVSALSRAQQRKILDVVEALIAQQSNGGS
jgi:transcriptional regulator with XRE-family HTH domain